MTLPDLLRLLRRYRFLAISVAVVFLAIGVYASTTPPDRYRSNATVLVEPDLTSDGQVVSVQVVDFLVPSYLARLGSDEFKDAAGADLPRVLRQAPISVSGASTPGTGIINIDVSSTVQGAVAPWAEALALQLQDVAEDAPVTLTLLDQPVRPATPYAPQRMLIFGAAAVVALLMTIFSVMFAGALRARNEGVNEIKERFGTRLLAEIPRLRRSLASLPPDQLERQPGARPTLEALHTLRVNVSYALSERTHPWIAVVSAGRREGTTFVAVELAWLLAAIDGETVLLDGDARQASAARALDLDTKPGLSDVEGSFAAALQPTKSDNLWFLAPGALDRHPAEHAAMYLPRVLADASDSGVALVVDCPPIVGAAESMVYATGCGAVLLVIDAKRRDLDDVEQTMAMLQDRKVDVIGVVINRSRASRRRPTSRGNSTEPE